LTIDGSVFKIERPTPKTPCTNGWRYRGRGREEERRMGVERQRSGRALVPANTEGHKLMGEEGGMKGDWEEEGRNE